MTKAGWLPLVLLGLASALCPSGAWAQADEDCLVCHEDSALKAADGRSLFVDKDRYAASIHGQGGMACVDCHADLQKVKDFPHAERLKRVDCAACHDKAAAEMAASVHGTADAGARGQAPGCGDCHGTHDIRPKDDYESLVFPLNLPRTCERCHLKKTTNGRGPEFVLGYQRSVHFRALDKAGLTQSANCSDCHGGHFILSSKDPRSRVSRKNIIPTCGRCHVGIERGYLEGVHGKDYAKGIKDVPVCTDCHSEHDILSPQDNKARIYATKVSAVCSRCHDDEALSRKYGFLTSRLKTYADSFHGTASKFGETRVANCASCHGFHDIRPSSDPESSIHAANLPTTCGQCHPGAGRNFARGKIHVVEEKVSNRWAHFVKRFYIILIAVVISVALIFIGADIFRRARERWKK